MSLLALVLAGCTGTSTVAAGPGPLPVTDTDTDANADTDTGAGDTDTAPDTDTDTGVPDSGDSDSAPVVVPPPAPCDSWGTPRDMGLVEDTALQEISSVEPSTLNPGVLWVLEDHGGEAMLYALDTAGHSLGTITIEGATDIDWEAMALGECDEGWCLWIGDTGDNDYVRTDISLLRVPEPKVSLAGGFALTEAPTRFPIAYPDGVSQNAEALALTPEGRPVIVTKRSDGTSQVYILDALVADVPMTLRLLGTISTRDTESGGFATSADIWPDGSRMLLRTYDHAWEYELGEAGIEQVATAPRIAMPFSDVIHVESVAYDPVLRGYWQIPEAVHAPIAFTPCAD
jgi:hypothetical protein